VFHRSAPLLSEMEKTVLLDTAGLASAQPLSTYVSTYPGSGDPPFTLFVRDAWSNPEHIKFGVERLLGGEAYAYIIYNAVDWPGISNRRSQPAS